jgi:hypothetical protein
MLSRKIVLAFALTPSLCVCSSWAQNQQQPDNSAQQQQGNAPQTPIQPVQPQDNAPQTPIQPVQPADSGIGATHQMPAAAARGLSGEDSQPDNTPVPAVENPLTGVETFGLGSPIGTHNLFDAALHVSIGGETDVVPGGTNFLVSAGGIVGLNRSWSRYLFRVAYAGGENLNYPGSSYNGGFQDLSAAQTIRWRRTTLHLLDDFTQSTGAAFGGLSTGGPGLTLPTGVATTVAPTFVPDESILTGQGDRVSDAILGEVDYQLSRRSTVTFGGSYGLLHFLTSGYIDSQNEAGQIGYGYQLDRKDTLGFVFYGDHFSFNGSGGSFTSTAIQAAFGRRLIGRTAIHISAGPQYIPSTPGVPSQFSWTVSAGITHQVRRTTYSAGYGRYVTNGSGVLLGAETQTVSASISTVISRTWTSSLTGGYAFNSNLVTDATAAGVAQYRDWYGAVNFGRLWDRLVRTNFSYELQRQTQSGTSCPVLNCGPSTLLQEFSFTVDLHIRPVAIE